MSTPAKARSKPRQTFSPSHLSGRDFNQKKSAHYMDSLLLFSSDGGGNVV
jgi:hypothetical protein